MNIKFLAALVCLILTGCWALPPYQEIDYGKRPDGSTYIRDTPRTWKFMKEDTDRAVALEKSGRPPGGGMRSWEENWERVIRNIRNGQQENPERYVEYIVRARREAGLPKLSFLAAPREPNQSLQPTALLGRG